MTTDLKTPLQVHHEIEAYAKTASPDVRRWDEPLTMKKVNGKMHPQWVGQGDLQIAHCKAIPKDAVVLKGGAEIQLAQGTTQGSRHMLQMREGVTLYRVAKPGPLDGGYIEAKERCYIAHPEHAHMDLPPGLYAVTYQQDLGADELRAVRD